MVKISLKDSKSYIDRRKLHTMHAWETALKTCTLVYIHSMTLAHNRQSSGTGEPFGRAFRYPK